MSDTYKVHSTIILPSSEALDFSGTSRARKLNKAQTKRSIIIGVQYFPVFGIAYALINRIGVRVVLSFILTSLHFLVICANSPFRLHLRYRQSSTPPWLGREYDFVQPCLPPTSNEANMMTMTPPVSANLSVRPPLLLICNRCWQPTASNKNLGPLGKILIAAGGCLIFCGC